MQYAKWRGIIVKVVSIAVNSCYVRELETDKLHIVDRSKLASLTPEELALLKLASANKPVIKFSTNCGTEAYLEVTQQDIDRLKI